KEIVPLVKEWQERSLSDTQYPYLITDVIYIKVRENRRVVSKVYHIAIGITEYGKREIFGFIIQVEENEDNNKTFFEHINDRNLSGLEMVVSDAHKGLVAAIRKSFTNVSWQRCQVHFLKNILSKIPKKNSKDFRDAVKAIFRLTNIDIARTMKNTIVNEY